MKIILLNLFDAFFAGISAFIFFQTILGKKHSKLPYYSVLAIYIVGYTSYNALTLHLPEIPPILQPLYVYAFP